ncbi:MAG: YaaL family protein [Bacillota bacterium]|nr:YaaL family protein [Bacillota bacterium]
MEYIKGIWHDIKVWLLKLWRSFFVVEEKDELKDNINKAKEEWEYAKMFFQEATEPDIIDYAIFQLDAAERKYMYLLEQAKIAQTNKKEVEAN